MTNTSFLIQRPKANFTMKIKKIAKFRYFFSVETLYLRRHKSAFVDYHFYHYFICSQFSAQRRIWDYYTQKNVPSKFLLKMYSTDLVEGVQSNISKGYCLIFLHVFKIYSQRKFFTLKISKLS